MEAAVEPLARSARADVLGCRIDRLDMDQTLARCEEVIAGREYVQQVSINTAKLVSLHDDERMRDIVNRCGLINADGQGVVWASKILGDPLPGRVPGIDLMHRLMALSEERGYRVYILGAKREVLDLALTRLREQHPGLEVAGSRDGYFADDEIPAVCDEIRAAEADILFVAISSPRKEYFLGEYGDSLGVPLVMGVGGSIDVVAGVTKRAPRWMQAAGLEWLFRVLQEPGRLWKRYAKSNARFAVLMAGALARRLTRRR